MVKGNLTLIYEKVCLDLDMKTSRCHRIWVDELTVMREMFALGIFTSWFV
jgi:hypothetical protein